jgi:helix-hairpin-helix protein
LATEEAMATKILTRRTVLRTAALPTSAFAAPFVHRTSAAETAVPKAKMTLAWHTNISPRWLDSGQHDGGATPGPMADAAGGCNARGPGGRRQSDTSGVHPEAYSVVRRILAATKSQLGALIAQTHQREPKIGLVALQRS